jgi:hypothetical protein
MHHLTAVILVLVIACVVLGGTVLVVRRAAINRLRSTPGYEEWDRARKQLARREKLDVLRATLRHQPVDRPALEQAQLAFVRFRQHENERASLRRRPKLRVAVAATYLVLAVADAILAVMARGGPYGEYAVEAVLFAALGLTWVFVIPRSVIRQPQQMAELRRRIEQRHGD